MNINSIKSNKPRLGLYDKSTNNAIRRAKAGDFIAQELIGAYRGLPKGLTHYDLLEAFNAAFPSLSISRGAAQLYNLVFDMTNKKDWEKNRLALIWASNATLMKKLHIKHKTQLKRYIRELRNLGLIAFKDSPTRKRYGRRKPDGTIDYANSFGIVLNSIAGLFEDFMEKAKEWEAQAQYQKTIRRNITIYRRERDSLMWAGIDQELPRPTLENFHDEFSLLDEQIAQSGKDYGLKETLLTEYRERLDALLELLFEATSQSIDKPDIDCPEKADDGEVNILDCAPTGAHSVPPNTTITLSTESRGNRLSERVERREGRVKHKMLPAKVSISQVKCILPYPIKAKIREDWGFYEIFDLMRENCRDYDVSEHVLDEARQLMGFDLACACIAVIIAKHGSLHRPESYLRGMMQKYSGQSLRIERSLFGIIAESKKPNNLMGELNFGE